MKYLIKHSKLFFIFHIFFFIFLISYFSFSFAQNPNYRQGEILIQTLKPLNSVSFKRTFPQLKSIETVADDWQIYLLKFDTKIYNEIDFIQKINKNSNVRFAQFNYFVEMRGQQIPDDAYFFPNQWSLHNIGQNSGSVNDADIDAPEAWDITTGGLTKNGDTIVIAVVDGGFQIDHIDMDYWKNNLEIAGNKIDDDGNGYIDDVNGWNASTNNGIITPDNHGQHVAGIAGAKGNNGIGVSGVNWNVKIMAVQVADATEEDVVRAYNYISKQRKLYHQTNGKKGAFVVATNSSFGINKEFPKDGHLLWCGMYDSLGAVGILSAAATTNNSWDVDKEGDIPTTCPSEFLISVTNTTEKDLKRTGGSESGAAYGKINIDLGAPGTNIYSTVSKGKYDSMSGCSMSSPLVAGVVGLMYAAACPKLFDDYKNKPDSMALVMRNFLLDNVDHLSSLENYTATGGRLNAHKPLQAICNYCKDTSCSTVSINEFRISDGQIRIYPNPTTGIFTLIMNNEQGIKNIEIKIYNFFGEVVHSTRISYPSGRSGGASTIDLSHLLGGIYFLNLILNNQKSKMMKVVVY